MIAMLTRRTAADGSETWMEIISKKLLRRAMNDSKGRAAQGIGPDCSSIPKLAAAINVSPAYIGFLVSDGKSSRKTLPVEKAEAIAAALGWDRDELFTVKRIEKAA